MEINEIIEQLKAKFGDKLDMVKVTELLKGVDHSKLDINEIIEKIKGANFLGDLDGDGKQESLLEELKGKAGDMLGGLGHMFGK